MSAVAKVAKSDAPTMIRDRVDALGWQRIGDDLDARGNAVVERLFNAEQCASVASMYVADERFRSRVVMARHGYGRGEYRYFRYPLPEPISELRTALYPYLAVTANRSAPPAKVWKTALAGRRWGFLRRSADRICDIHATAPIFLMVDAENA